MDKNYDALRSRLAQSARDLLDRLEAQKKADGGDPDAIVGELDRQAREIADDLRRVDRLIRGDQGSE